MKKKFGRKNVMIQTTHRFDLWQLHLWIHTPTDLGTSLNPTQSGKSAVSLCITWHPGGSGVYDFSLPFSGELSTCMTLLLYGYSRLFLYFPNQPLDLLLSVTWGSIVTAVVYPESPCNHEPWIVSAVIPKWFEFSTGSMASGFSEAQSITKASHCLIHQDLQQCSALSSVVSAWRSSVVIGCPFIFISL